MIKDCLYTIGYIRRRIKNISVYWQFIILMRRTKKPPKELSERKLFNEFIELTSETTQSLDGYETAILQKRQAELLAEIGERLETLEAIKALLDVDTEYRNSDEISTENLASQ